MSDMLKIRTVTSTDFPMVFRLWQSSGLILTEYEKEKKEFECIVSRNGDTCLVACIGSSIIGCVLGTFNGRRAWIYHLAVDRHWQGNDVGTMLLERVEALCIQKGATKIMLGVMKSNIRVVPFYQKQGYAMQDEQIIFEKDVSENNRFLEGGEMYENKD